MLLEYVPPDVDDEHVQELLAAGADALNVLPQDADGLGEYTRAER